MRLRQKLRWSQLLASFLLSIGLIVGGIWLSHWRSESLTTLANVSQALGLGLSLVTAWVSLRPAPTMIDSEQGADRAAAMLASVVRQQWAHELDRFELRSVALPIRWSVRRTSVGKIPELEWTRDLRKIAVTFAQLPTLRLVVLGKRGAGKSSLAAMLAVGLVDRRQVGDPVPILLSLSSWRPGRESFEDTEALPPERSSGYLIDIRSQSDPLASCRCLSLASVVAHREADDGGPRPH